MDFHGLSWIFHMAHRQRAAPPVGGGRLGQSSSDGGGLDQLGHGCRTVVMGGRTIARWLPISMEKSTRNG